MENVNMALPWIKVGYRFRMLDLERSRALEDSIIELVMPGHIALVNGNVYYNDQLRNYYRAGYLKITRED